ncbi:hypothetical protein GCM10009789_40040 [Kribbella sancticallisti]|uniref:Uncharacterized protein n=1 Tax=Kribbella sancticallisti TaxID=460087 RepID=A0ABP4PPD6_9ACTN
MRWWSPDGEDPTTVFPDVQAVVVCVLDSELGRAIRGPTRLRRAAPVGNQVPAGVRRRPALAKPASFVASTFFTVGSVDLRLMRWMARRLGLECMTNQYSAGH